MRKDSPTDDLRREHRLVLADLTEAQVALQELKPGPGAAGPAQTLRSRLGQFQEGLLLHFQREEQFVYPEASRAGLLGEFMNSEAEEDLRAHQVISTRTEELIAAARGIAQAGEIDTQALSRLRTIFGLTRTLLERHASKEDTLIFPMIERGLSAEQLMVMKDHLREASAVGDLTGPGDPKSGPGLTRLSGQD